MSQIKWSFHLLLRYILYFRLPLFSRQATHIIVPQFERSTGVKNLHDSLAPLFKGGTQALMSPHNLFQTPDQGRHQQRPIQAYASIEGIGDIARLQLLQEPEALLGKR